VDETHKEKINLFKSVVQQSKTESKREKSKPLQVTRLAPIHKIKKLKEQRDTTSSPKLDDAIEMKNEDVNKVVDETNLKTEESKPLNTIERLRKEALGLEKKKKKSKEISVFSTKIIEDVKNENSTIANSDADFNLINQMNVHKLRHYARKFPDFPIKGREISRANRDVLVEWFKAIKNN
jgi:hypothetical protein